MKTTVPLGILSAQIYREAQSYIEAAEILSKASSESLPKYFLLSHALELTLKAYLTARGTSLGGLFKIGHDLEKAYTRALKLGLRSKNEKMPLLVKSLSEFHREHVFRYPTVNKEGELVIIRTLVEANELIDAVKEIIQSIQGAVLAARLDAVSGGKVAVEEWHMS